jgi:hypothetical protein
MPLRTVNLINCKKLTDLSPLADAPLVQIHLPPAPQKIDGLRGMKTLTTINNLPSNQFWKLWDAAKGK